MNKNLCDLCAHRKVCICEDSHIPTEDCRYYDPQVVHCRDCIGKSTWQKNPHFNFYECEMSGLIIVEDSDFCSFGERINKKEEETRERC